MFHFFIAAFLASSASFALPKVALNWKPEAQFGGFYAADKSLELLPGGSGTPTLQMLLAGKTDYAVVSGDEIVIAHDRGNTEVVALFATYQTNPQILMAHASKNYKNIPEVLADPKATILWQQGLPYAQYLIKKLGPIKAKTAPYAGGIGNFQNDPNIVQQGFLTSEPQLAQKAGIETTPMTIASAGFNPYTTVLATTKKRLKEKPQEVKEVVQKLRQGWTDYLKDPTLTNEKMLKLNPSNTAEILKISAQQQKPLIETEFTAKNALGKMTSDRWKTLVDQLADLKIIKSKPTPESLYQDL